MRTPEALALLSAGASMATPVSINNGWSSARALVAAHDVGGLRALRVWALRDARRYPADMRRTARVLLARLIGAALWDLTMPEAEAVEVWGYPGWSANVAEAMRVGARKAAA